jgi:splicing factor 3B subunit 3
MHLYNLTLSPPTSITHTLLGSFSATKQELILVRGASILELYNDQLVKIATHKVVGLIRTIAAVRLTGSGRDYIVMTSDSGYVTILEYTNEFKIVHNELFGKSGVRRVTPGQYIAQDPKGRAIMLAALEKNKLVYILNRDINTK